MAFIQIVDFTTSKPDEVKRLADEWEAAAADQRTARRRTVCRDRDNPGRHVIIVLFDSYEDAMRNSEMPVTREFAQRMGELCDAPATFHNLDVVDESEL